MSVFCPKCGKRTYNEYTCDHCQYEIKPKDNVNTNKSTVSINKNTILISAVVVIAISVAYLGISKYRENKAAEEFAEMLVGTSDPEEIKEIIKKANDPEGIKQMMEEAKKELEQTINNVPTLNIPESQYEKERRLKKEYDRKIELQKQSIAKKNQRESEKAKEELKKQMAL